MKIIACIYRPWILDPRVHPVKEAIPTATGYSFPSGHTTNATNLFGGLVLRGHLSKALKIILIAGILLVGFSRIYLGVHTIIDVSFAIIFTLIILVFFSKLYDMLDEKPNLDIIISSVAIIIGILILIYTMTKSYPLDYNSAGKLIVDPAIMTIDTFKYVGVGVGVFLSWPIERRYIKFSTEGTLKRKILRFICGLIPVIIIKKCLSPLLGDDPLGGFLQFFVVMIFIMLIYPIIIKLFQKRNNQSKI